MVETQDAASAPSAPVQSSGGMTETTSPTPQERMLPQSKVESIVRERLHEKENRLRSEYEAKIAEMQKPQIQPTNMGGFEQLNPEQIRNMVAEETKKQQDRLAKEYVDYVNQQQAQELVGRFNQKIESGKSKYSDFDEKLNTLQIGKIPAIVQLAESVDNTADVMYDLAENPHKIANILQFANNPDTYHLAQIAMQRLSNSIKTNEEAKSMSNANAPLSKVKPSITGTDNGKKGVRDLRRESWLRA